MLWIVAGLSALYFGFFTLLFLDEVVLQSRWIMKSVDAIGPGLQVRVTDALRAIYSPLILAMKFLKIIP